MDIEEQKKTWSNFTKLVVWASLGVIVVSSFNGNLLYSLVILINKILYFFLRTVISQDNKFI